jgi:hypothetical protein
MRRAYWILLQLYPRRYRAEFAEEMLAVFTRVAEERRAQGRLAYTRFFVNECAGLLGGAVGELPSRMSLVAPLGGLAVAAILHATFYAATSRVLSATTAAVERSAAGADEQAKLLLLVTVSVVWLLFFLLVSMRLVRLCR